MLSTTPILRSAAARTLFFSSSIVTAGILLWAHYFNGSDLAPIFRLLFAVHDAEGAGWLLAVLVLAVFVSGRLHSAEILRWVSDHMLWVAIATVLVLCAGSLIVYRNHPLAMDEYAPYLQSQIFAAGKFSGNFPVALMDWLVPPGFQNYFISVSKVTGDVASAYWPSFALLLTPFTALGIPWACNPVISALTLVVAHRLGLKIYGDRDVAAMVVLFTVASPVIFLDGISYYSMSAHLLANALYALLLIDPTPRKAALAGVVGSIALTLHNPVPHILFAAPWIIWLLTRDSGLRLSAWLAVGYAPLCLILGVGWFWFTGHLRQAGLPVGTGGHSLSGMLDSLSVFPSFGVDSPGTVCRVRQGLGVGGTWTGDSRLRRKLERLATSCSAIADLVSGVDPARLLHGTGGSGSWLGISLLSFGLDRTAVIGRRRANAHRGRAARNFFRGCKFESFHGDLRDTHAADRGAVPRSASAQSHDGRCGAGARLRWKRAAGRVDQARQHILWRRFSAERPVVARSCDSHAQQRS